MKRRMEFWTIILLIGVLLLSGCAAAENVSSETTLSETQTADNVTVHHFPESLPEFEAVRRGVEALDLSSAATLRVVVANCLYAEPVQVFHDASVIEAAAAVMETIQVTGKPDGITSTAPTYGFFFEDANGEILASFSFQDDEGLKLEMGDVGRYPIKGDGLNTLFSLEEILLTTRQWEDYHNGLLAASGLIEEGEYAQSVFALSSNENAQTFWDAFRDTAGTSIEIRIDGEASGEPVTCEDPDTVVKLLDAMSSITVSGPVEENVTDSDCIVTFLMPDGTARSLCFEGSWLNVNGQNYALKNASEFWNLVREINPEAN